MTKKVVKTEKNTKKKTTGKKRKKTVVVKKKKLDLDEVGIKKQKEFRMFLLWQTLPTVFRGKSKNYLKEIGIADEDALDLLEIRTMSEFAKRYKLKNGTLTDWKKKITEREMVDESRDFFKKLSKNVYASFYHKTIEHGDAQRVRLWEEMFNEKDPEGSTGKLPALLGENFNEIIIKLSKSYDSKLREEYEKQIRKKGKENKILPSS